MSEWLTGFQVAVAGGGFILHQVFSRYQHSSPMGDQCGGSEHGILLLLVYKLFGSNYLHTIRNENGGKEEMGTGEDESEERARGRNGCEVLLRYCQG